MNKKYRKMTGKVFLRLAVLTMTWALVAGCGPTPAAAPAPTATQTAIPTVSPTETPVPPTTTPEPTATLKATDTSGPESETISAEPVVEEVEPVAETQSEVEMAINELHEEVLSAELLRSFGFESWEDEKMGDEQRAWLSSIVGGTDLIGLEGDMQTAIDNGTFYDSDGSINMEWRNRVLEMMMGVMKERMRAKLDKLTDADGEINSPRLLQTQLNIGGKPINIIYHTGNRFDELYEDNQEKRHARVALMQELMNRSDLQADFASKAVRFWESKGLNILNVRDNSYKIDMISGEAVEVQDLTPGVGLPDEIHYYVLNEGDDSLITDLRNSSLAVSASSTGEDMYNGVPLANFVWYTEVVEGRRIMKFVNLAPGNRSDLDTPTLLAQFMGVPSNSVTNLMVVLGHNGWDSFNGKGPNDYVVDMIESDKETDTFELEMKNIIISNATNN